MFHHNLLTTRSGRLMPTPSCVHMYNRPKQKFSRHNKGLSVGLLRGEGGFKGRSW
jgi:hypothetical protein